MHEWYTLQPEAFRLMDEGTKLTYEGNKPPDELRKLLTANAHTVADIMYKLADINYDFYRVAARAYYENSQALEPPARAS